MIALFALVGCLSQAPDVPPETGPVTFAPSPLRRLSQAEYRNTVGDLLGVEAANLNLPADDVVGAFLANVRSSVSPLAAEQYAAAAQTSGGWVTRNPDAVVECSVAEGACVEGFIDSFGAAAWRRPLTVEDRDALRAVFDVASEPERGLGLVVEAVLQSPDFLYLVETGEVQGDTVVLDGFSVAARLSYFLWGTTPDAALLEAAAEGRLDTPAGVDAEARRLLTSSRALVRIQAFYRQWLNFDELPRVDKDRERFPLWDDTLVAAMQEELDRFVAYVYTDGPGTMESLLTTPVAFPSGPLWAVYGLQPTEGDGPVGVSPTERAGVLTLPGVQAAHAHLATTSPIHRGLFVYERVFCRELGGPPADVDLTPIVVEQGESLTKREQFAQHQTEPVCAGCHQAIDPLGFLFEHYGTLGNYRTFAPEEGQPVDAADTVQLVSDLDGPYADAVTFVKAAANSEEVRRCLVTQWARFAWGRDDEERDETTLDALDARFAATGGDLRALLIAIVTSEAFRSRALPGETP
ncbi:MAG: DUF1592 domain-containing protein [Myxococcota bacterium]